MIEVLFTDQCNDLLDKIDHDNTRKWVTEAVNNWHSQNRGNRGIIVTNSRLLAVHWVNDTEFVFVDSVISRYTANHVEGNVEAGIQEVTVHLALRLDPSLPSRIVNWDMPVDVILQEVAASFGSLVTGHPEEPASLLYSGRWDGKSVRSTKAVGGSDPTGTIYEGTFNAETGTCALVWALDQDRYLNWYGTQFWRDLIRVIRVLLVPVVALILVVGMASLFSSDGDPVVLPFWVSLTLLVIGFGLFAFVIIPVEIARWLVSAGRAISRNAASPRHLNQTNPEQAREKTREGLRILAAGNNEAAIATFTEAIANDPAIRAAYWNRARACRNLGRLAEAEADEATFRNIPALSAKRKLESERWSSNSVPPLFLSVYFIVFSFVQAGHFLYAFFIQTDPSPTAELILPGEVQLVFYEIGPILFILFLGIFGWVFGIAGQGSREIDRAASPPVKKM